MDSILKNMIFQPQTYKLKIIDTIDHLILTLDNFNIKEEINEFSYLKTNFKKYPIDIIDKVTNIYINMEILAEIIETPFTVTEKEFNILIDICGKNIPIKENANKDNILYNKIITDFFKILEFSKIKDYWNELKTTNLTITKNQFEHSGLWNIEKSREQIVTNVSNSDNVKSTSTRKDNALKTPLFEENKYEKGEPVPFTGSEFYCDLNNNDGSYLTNINNNFKYIDDKELVSNNLAYIYHTYILYNSLYNVSIILKKEEQEIIDIIIKDFPEFIVVDKIDELTEENYNLLYKFFNNKIFSSITDLQDKVKSLKNLYDIDIKDNNNDIGKKYSEKDEVLMIINKTYEQNNNSNDKLKASEIYTLIENYFPLFKGNLTFRKRVSGYLIETGLSRKRVSDGIYYYGLKKKEYKIEKTYDNKEKTYNINIEDIMKQRDDELLQS
jgi:hypothetical protein